MGRTGSGVGGYGATDPQSIVGLLVGRVQVLELPGLELVCCWVEPGPRVSGCRALGFPRVVVRPPVGRAASSTSWLWGARCRGSWYQLAGGWAGSLDGSQGVLKLDQLEWGCVLVPVS